MMKKLFIATLIMACSTAASAATIVWEPKSPGNITVNTLNLNTAGWELGMFDDAAALTDANALSLAGVSAEVEFTAAGSGDWSAENLAIAGPSITLTGGKQFVLAVTDGLGSWFEATNAVLLSSGTTNYEVIFSNEVSQVFTFDAIPTVVPVPAAVWLFGSGVISLVGLARRKTS